MSGHGPVCISVRDLSKRYDLGAQARTPYATVRDGITSAARRLARSVANGSAGLAQDTEREFWALRDVSFDIHQGERIGIIGRNGAGKSTLLKILGRVTEPTRGRVEIRGRMASLLEVGVGFHPELTGRGNIFLNGAVLGMRRAEILRKFDAIVDFAEIEPFLDTPVKRYSSGMYVRLAFAIAAHLDSDILVLDEVLAVGDLHFQKKCLQQVHRAVNDGRTVLLVSHNMTTILGLSTRCMLLTSGRLTDFGETDAVIHRYQKTLNEDALGRTDLTQAERYGSGAARFTTITLAPLDESGHPLPFPALGCDLRIGVELEAREPIKHATVGATIYDEIGARLVDVATSIKGQSVSLGAGDRASISFRLRNVRLKPDLYTISLWLGIPNVGDIDGIPHARTFQMQPQKNDTLYTAPLPGPYMCEFELHVEAEATTGDAR